MLVEQEETIRRVIDEAAEARLARAQLILGPFALRDVATPTHRDTERPSLAQNVANREPRPGTRSRPCAYGESRK